jgi:hypothetical protein
MLKSNNESWCDQYEYNLPSRTHVNEPTVIAVDRAISRKRRIQIGVQYPVVSGLPIATAYVSLAREGDGSSRETRRYSCTAST